MDYSSILERLRISVSGVWSFAHKPLSAKAVASVLLWGCSTINLKNTQTAVLPSAFSSTITDLDLSRNEISVLPTEMKDLAQLTSLNISENKIALLPPWLGKLRKLRVLRAFGNPLTGDQKLFAEKLLGSDEALLGYLTHCHEQVPARRLTVTVLGNFMAGKTALLNALLNIPPPKRAERTVHVTFAEFADNTSGLSFSLRELPGQAQFYVGNQRFLYSFNNALALVVVKLSDRYHARELEQLRLYLSRVQYNAGLAHDIDAKAEPRAATIIVCTHRDQFLDEKRGTLGELQEWARETELKMRKDYPMAGVCGVLLLNCKDQKGARKELLGAMVSVGQQVLRDRTVPKYTEDAHRSFNTEAARKRRPAWATKADAVSLLSREGLGEGSASFALEALQTMGDIICIGSNVVILDPAWLSIAISALVLPPQPPFFGIEEGRGANQMLNGVASFTTLRDWLMKATVGSGWSRRALVRNADEAEMLLSWLVGLDILVPLQTPVVPESESKTATAGSTPVLSEDLKYLVPARLVAYFSCLISLFCSSRLLSTALLWPPRSELWLVV